MAVWMSLWPGILTPKRFRLRLINCPADRQSRTKNNPSAEPGHPWATLMESTIMTLRAFPAP